MSTPVVRITGFSTASNRRLLCALAIAVCTLCGWTLAGPAAAAAAALMAVLAVCIPWWGQPAWSWLLLWLRTRSVIQWTDPITVANNRSGGGVRIHDGVAVVAVRLLGRAHAATLITGSVSVHTDNTVDVAALAPLLKQSLGLNLESLSVITAGARRGVIGDYPRVYDTLIGTPPYAGRRETWLIMRMRVIDNTGSLRWRTTVGATAIALAQRVAGTLRCQGLRARVATANDIIELERRLGIESLTAPSQRWTTLRADTGWWTTYAYPAGEINTETLAAAWNLPVDDVIQNITVLPDGTCTATVTVRTPQPSPTPPAVVLARLNGEQAAAAAANLCGPRPHLRGLRPAPLPDTLSVEIGPSGILIGKLANGDRLLVPLTDSGELSRVFIAAEEQIAKRFVIRAAGAGERVCVHGGDPVQWASVRMPGIAVVDGLRPLPRTTVSVIDHAMTLSPRPATVITVAAPGTPPPPAGAVEVTIEQINRSTVRISAAGRSWLAEVELFRAENRYCSDQSFTPAMAN